MPAAPEIPDRYVRVVSVKYHRDGDHAVVELLTNEEPRLYPYTVFCERDASGADGTRQADTTETFAGEAARRLGLSSPEPDPTVVGSHFHVFGMSRHGNELWRW